MRLGNRIHQRHSQWVLVGFVIGAFIVLPGATKLVAQDDRSDVPREGDDQRWNENSLESLMLSDDLNLAKQISIKTNFVDLPSHFSDDLGLPWIQEQGQSKHGTLDADATEQLLKTLSENQHAIAKSSPRVSLFDGQNWHLKQAGQRTFVTAWKPFEGQKNQPVKTMSPITEVTTIGLNLKSNVKWLKATNEIEISVTLERTWIAKVETSQFTYALDIGGEPHPIQTPQLETNKIQADGVIPVHGSMVLSEPSNEGISRLTILQCLAVLDTPEVAEDVAKFRKTREARSGDVPNFDSKTPRVIEKTHAAWPDRRRRKIGL